MSLLRALKFYGAMAAMKASCLSYAISLPASVMGGRQHEQLEQHPSYFVLQGPPKGRQQAQGLP